MSSLRPGKNPRGTGFTVDDLVESFSKGTPQLQNIVVRRVPGTREEFEVISGHRRLAAVKAMGWAQVEVKVVDVNDQTAELFALEENLRRQTLPDEATAMARLVRLYEAQAMVRHGGDRRSEAFRSSGQAGRMGAVAKAARATGQSERDVRRKARVGRLGSKKLKQALAAKAINILDAERLVTLPAKQQDEAIRVLRQEKSQPKVQADLRRVLDALAYVEKVLKRHQEEVLGQELINELRAKAVVVIKALDRLTSTPKIKARSGSKRLPPAARRGKDSESKRIGPAVSKRDALGTVHFEPKSCNRKLGPVGTTPGYQRPHFAAMKPYVASTSVSIQATCPESCAFKGAGCYSQSGFTAILNERMDAAAWGLEAEHVIAEEARQINAAFKGGLIPQDGARGGRDLRLHVGGDVGSARGARLLGQAAQNWKARSGGSVWTFTHWWRAIPRNAWGTAISVLASVETAADIETARSRGYAAAIVVEDFPDCDKAFALPGTKARIIPCPAETRGRTCIECRLCLDVDLLKLNAAIAFKIHGQGGAAAKSALRRSQEKRR
ncbi:ParB/RepB/Spo0J family partition protein [Pyxidicoccus sp. 3LG]